MKIPLAVIGGSGAYHLLNEQALGKKRASRRMKTPFGPSAPVHRLTFAGKTEILFLSRHGETDYSTSAPFVNYRANIYALKECGAERIISWSGPGVINRAMKPGEFVIPHDLIDETRRRESTFFKNRGHGFIRQSSPFCPQIRWALHESVHAAELPHHEGAVYVCTEGPRLETAAEIRKYRLLGADLVGMTLAPEAFLARELEMCYAPLCYTTNYAEGIVPRDFKEGELFEGMQTIEEARRVDEAMSRFPALLRAAFVQLKELNRSCPCKDALLRYKTKGILDDDWRNWIGDP